MPMKLSLTGMADLLSIGTEIATAIGADRRRVFGGVDPDPGGEPLVAVAPQEGGQVSAVDAYGPV